MTDFKIKRKTEYCLIFFIYIIITIIIFWHRIPDLGTNYGMPDIDTDGTLWYFWARMFTRQQSVLFSINNILLGFPVGFNYSFIPFFSLVYEINIFFIRLFGGSLSSIILISNLSVLFSYPLSAISAYFLSYYLTRNKYASFIAGLIYSFSTYHVMMGRGALSNNHIELIPIYFLSLIYSLDKRTTATYVISALILSLLFMSNAYFAFFSGLFSILFIIFYKEIGLIQKIREFVKYYVVLFSIIFLTNINFIVSQRLVLNSRNLEVLRNFVPESQLVSVLSFFSPSASTLLYPFANNGNNFMGYCALFISFLGLLILRNNRLFLLLFSCFLISILLASNIPGFYIINHMYFLVFGMFRAVSRINILSSLFLSLTSALVISYLSDKFLCFLKK